MFERRGRKASLEVCVSNDRSERIVRPLTCTGRFFRLLEALLITYVSYQTGPPIQADWRQED